MKGEHLHLEIFDAPQRHLWDELGVTPDHFTLYGGTALALQLGHRQSTDFDFFSTQPFDPKALLSSVPYLEGARPIQMAASTLTALVDRGGDVKVSYFAPPKPAVRIGRRVESLSPKLRLASPIDIAATKMAVISARPAAKDYLDIHALITKARMPLALQLAAADAVYPGQKLNPYITLKSLVYFSDGDLHTLPESVRRDLEQAVSDCKLSDIASYTARAAADPQFWTSHR